MHRHLFFEKKPPTRAATLSHIDVLSIDLSPGVAAGLTAEPEPAAATAC